ncbi:hypothetical protein [Paractinoplanes lichenicola]|uniref:CULT domain-containing protein n=1 Tax=Paractinoplanes lichenicola TaxID=2802976 RepID=A0ABS1VW03_9ACTN|nr:hypothetical protein [Actinoplanes lichenicola]MBL7258639.1 hypothetical protein [Actinoplanes lichenicola]
MDLFRCATCGNTLSVPIRLVELPAGPHWSLLSCHHVNPPRLAPGTYATDPSPYGRDQTTGTFVLSPGDVRGTRFVHDHVHIGCWSLAGWEPCMACDTCGTLVASRTDDCKVAQETRFDPATVIREPHSGEPGLPADQFALIADWDDPAPDTRRNWTPRPVRPRPELLATRWGGQGLAEDLYRDDPPA